jgi:hypothetical protein
MGKIGQADGHSFIPPPVLKAEEVRDKDSREMRHSAQELRRTRKAPCMTNRQELLNEISREEARLTARRNAFRRQLAPIPDGEERLRGYRAIGYARDAKVLRNPEEET